MNSIFALFLLTPLREGRPRRTTKWLRFTRFLLTPLREGRLLSSCYSIIWSKISTHAPAGGATSVVMVMILCVSSFLLTPLREGRLSAPVVAIIAAIDFYSRPCGRGDHPDRAQTMNSIHFYSRPCGRGDEYTPDSFMMTDSYFYSRPCGRGDSMARTGCSASTKISTHAPAGGATQDSYVRCMGKKHFYSRPCGRGDVSSSVCLRLLLYFYSRPCGRGDGSLVETVQGDTKFLLTPLREGRPVATGQLYEGD